MDKKLIAKASTTVNAPVERVWDALVNPKLIKQYVFGTNVASDWKEGSPITFKGEWQGKAYEDKGVILKVKPQQMLQYSLSQDNNATEEEKQHSEKNWKMMLESLKKLMEKKA